MLNICWSSFEYLMIIKIEYDECLLIITISIWWQSYHQLFIFWWSSDNYAMIVSWLFDYNNDNLLIILLSFNDYLIIIWWSYDNNLGVICWQFVDHVLILCCFADDHPYLSNGYLCIYWLSLEDFRWVSDDFLVM